MVSDNCTLICNELLIIFSLSGWFLMTLLSTSLRILWGEGPSWFGNPENNFRKLFFNFFQYLVLRGGKMKLKENIYSGQ